jgi:hydrogenase 3 maturation protease
LVILNERKTLPAIWKKSLRQLLDQRRADSGRFLPARVAILGVGNPLRSDDAAGVLVARALAQRDGGRDTDRVLIIDAGQAPENRTGELRKFSPDVVLIIDAADMGEKPGTVQWIPEESIEGMSASTHSLPLSMLAHYLKLELNCAVAFLGIQAASNEVGERVSTEVLQAIEEIVDVLDELIRLPQ